MEILEIKPLNTSKFLYFLLFKKAFFLYLENKKATLNKKLSIKSDILSLKAKMNNQRDSFIFPNDHKIYITPYLFLGFV